MNLAPEIIKMRDALLERIGDKPLNEVGQIVNEILLNETNNVNRLAALAARVKILKDKINKDFDIKSDINKKKVSDNLVNKLKKSEQKNNLEQDLKPDIDKWTRVEMIKSGIVNGVRFPAGVVIDVNQIDADKLVKDGLSLIRNTPEEEEENAELQDNNKVDATTVDNNKVDAAPVDAATVDNNKVDAASVDAPVDSNKVDAASVDAPVDSNKVDAAPVDAATLDSNKVDAAPVDDPEDSNKVNAATVDKDVVKKEIIKEKETKQKRQAAPSLKKTEDATEGKKILKTKSTKITEETIELTDPKAVAEALGLNEAKKKEEEPKEIEEEIDFEALEKSK